MVFWITAVLVVAILSFVALYYTIRVRKHDKRNKAYHARAQQVKKERDKKNIQSIIVLSRGLLVDQVTLTEASIRIAWLLDCLELPDHTKQDCVVFTQLADACQHIPILDEWKFLSKKEKQRYTLERESIENKYSDFVMATAKKIVEGEITLF